MPRGSAFALFGPRRARRRFAARPPSGSLNTIDATCPLVTKVHREAIRYAKAGYTIVLIGHAGHDEVVGTMGEAPEALRCWSRRPRTWTAWKFADPEKVGLSHPDDPVGGRRGRTIAGCVQRFPQIVGPPRRTFAMPRRTGRKRCGSLSREADMVLVVGSQNSSNSRRLAEMARAAACRPTDRWRRTTSTWAGLPATRRC